MMETEIAGERLALLPERALFWEREETLFVADLHIGKAAAFRAAAIPIPGGTTADDLDRLSRVIERTGARRMILLGDLLHAQAGRAPRTLAAVSAWRSRYPALEMLLVRGNHDERAGDPLAEWHIGCFNEPIPYPPFVLRHRPDESAEGYTLAGHVHPAVNLSGKGRQSLRLPCFYFSPRLGILPAFGSFTGTATLRPRPADQVFVVAGDELVRCS